MNPFLVSNKGLVRVPQHAFKVKDSRSPFVVEQKTKSVKSRRQRSQNWKSKQKRKYAPHSSWANEQQRDVPLEMICLAPTYDELSTISEVSEGDSSSSTAQSCAKSPLLADHGRTVDKQEPRCSIQALDMVGEGACFLLDFDDSNNCVELQAAEVLEFCASLLDYDSAWVFQLKIQSSGLVIQMKAGDVVGSLQFLLASMVKMCQEQPSDNRRKTWQKGWDFDETES